MRRIILLLALLLASLPAQAQYNYGTQAPGIPLAGATLPGQFYLRAPGLTGTVPDPSSWITWQPPAAGTRAFAFSILDQTGRYIERHFPDAGRIDLNSYDNGSGVGQGAVMSLVYNNSIPTAGDEAGHYAFRAQDDQLNTSTIAATYAYTTVVSHSAMSSKIALGYMNAVNGTGGVGQPNEFVTIDPVNGMVLPGRPMSGITGIGMSNTSGPTITLANTANSRNLIVGVLDIFNGGINSTGVGSLLLQVAGSSLVSISATRALYTTPILTATATVGGALVTATTGELGFSKIAATGTAPGAGGGKIEMVCGTNAGSLKIIAYGGTSTTPVTVVDNIGSGATGC